MELIFSKSFIDDYKELSKKTQLKLDRQLVFLLKDLRYPSIRAKKIEGYFDIWEGRIDRAYRFTFTIKESLYILRRAGTHDILKQP